MYKNSNGRDGVERMKKIDNENDALVAIIYDEDNRDAIENMQRFGPETKSYETVSANVAKVREQMREAALRAGRNPEDVTLVAVSKFQPAAAISALHGLGQLDFGENYVQEAQEKFLQDYGLEVSLTEAMGQAEHVFTHIRWKMQVYGGKVSDINGFAAGRRPYIWASREQLEQEIMLPVAFSKIKW